MGAPTLTPGASWTLTAAISPRRIVRAAERDAIGQVVNSYPLVHPVTGRVPATPWAVCLADARGRFRLLCFDLDAHAGPEPVQRDLAELSALLNEHGIGHLVCQSGPSGGAHVWIGLADAVDAEVVAVLARLVAGWLATVDPSPLLNPATGCVRPPGAPHRSGGASGITAGDLGCLTNPSVTADDVGRLVSALAERAVAKHRPLSGTDRTVGWDAWGQPFLPGPRRPLPPASREALARACDGSVDASAVLWRVLCGAAAAHWRSADVATLASEPGLEHVRTLRSGTRRIPRPASGGASPGSVLARQWRRAVHAMAATPTDRPGADPTFDARAELVAGVVRVVQMRADAATGRWQGRSGLAHRKVLDAVCLFELQAVRLDVEADIRRIALTCGLDRETTRRALLALARDGWLERTRPAVGPRAAHWTSDPAGALHIDVQRALSQADPRPHGSGAAQRGLFVAQLRDRLGAAAHDAFSPRHGLGPHAGALYAHLAAPTGSMELGKRLGWRPEEIERTVDLVVQEGLVEAAGGGWRRTEAEELDRTAERLGTSGHHQHRLARYSAERLAWQWWLAELDRLHRRHGRRARTTRDPARRPGPTASRHPRHSNGRADFASAHQLCHRWITTSANLEPKSARDRRRAAPTWEAVNRQIVHIPRFGGSNLIPAIVSTSAPMDDITTAGPQPRQPPDVARL